jgi:hypothetical protein
MGNRELAPYFATARLSAERRESKRRARWSAIRSACALVGVIIGLIIIGLIFGGQALARSIFKIG